MAHIFRAQHIMVSNEDGVSLVGFADRAVQPSAYLILQLAHTVDDQDRTLSMDTVYIEHNDQGSSAYGGIERCTLATAVTLKTEPEVEVQFALAPVELQRLTVELMHICTRRIPLVVAADVGG
jgi:hypothetical protein